MIILIKVVGPGPHQGRQVQQSEKPGHTPVKAFAQPGKSGDAEGDKYEPDMSFVGAAQIVVNFDGAGSEPPQYTPRRTGTRPSSGTA